jgi:hypothetical protein
MGEIEGQYGSREDPKKLALIREIPGNIGELVTLVLTHSLMHVHMHTHPHTQNTSSGRQSSVQSSLIFLNKNEKRNQYQKA